MSRNWVDVAISTLLRAGVVISVTIVLIGLFVMFAQNPLVAAGGRYPKTLAGVFDGLAHARGQAIVMAGLLLLIATPVARVALSIVIFVVEHDRLYTAITTAVMTILLIAFALGVEA